MAQRGKLVRWAVLCVGAALVLAPVVQAWTNPVPVLPKRTHYEHRPAFHFTPPQGWMNDPIRPVWHNQKWHLFYNYNPHETKWGQIHWGHAVSPDLVHWKDEQIALAPGLEGNAPDRRGVFTGSVFVPDTEHMKMIALFTGAQEDGIKWDHPHAHGSETQNIATSKDGGVTWVKEVGNPILADAYDDGGSVMDVTGFRDPFIMTWPREHPTHYRIIISGGIQEGKGGDAFLYTTKGFDLSSWDYDGSMIADDSKAIKTELCAGSVNWECVTEVHAPISKGDDKSRSEYTFLTMGVEPGPTGIRSAYWISGLGTEDGRLDSRHGSKGLIDHGILYAVTSFDHHADGRHIIVGWVPEAYSDGVDETGFSGALGVPRQVFASDILPKPMVLGIKPIREIDELRGDSVQITSVKESHTVNIIPSKTKEKDIDGQYVDIPFEALFTETGETDEQCFPKVKLSLLTSKSGLAGVAVYFSPVGKAEDCSFENSNEMMPKHICVKVLVDLEKSNLAVCQDGRSPCTNLEGMVPVRETSPGSYSLYGRVIVDRSTIEIFANDLLALTARAYKDPGRVNLSTAVQSCGRPSPFHAELVEMTVYGVKSIWTMRHDDGDDRPWNIEYTLLLIAGSVVLSLGLGLCITVCVMKAIKTKLVRRHRMSRYSILQGSREEPLRSSSVTEQDEVEVVIVNNFKHLLG